MWGLVMERDEAGWVRGASCLSLRPVGDSGVLPRTMGSFDVTKEEQGGVSPSEGMWMPLVLIQVGVIL